MAKSQTAHEEKPRIRTETEERYLRCDLTDEEFRDQAAALTRAIDDLHNIEEDAKAVKSDLKSRADKEAAEVARLNNIVRNRYEMRQIECNICFNLDSGQVTIIRKDTGEIFETRDMKQSERERQAELFAETEAA